MYALYIWKVLFSNCWLLKLKNHSIYRYFENTIHLLFYEKYVLRFSKRNLSHKRQIASSCLPLYSVLTNPPINLYSIQHSIDTYNIEKHFVLKHYSFKNIFLAAVFLYLTKLLHLLLHETIDHEQIYLTS